MLCKKCGTEFDGDICTSCELKIIQENEASAKMLTEANLLRIRGDIEGAIKICLQAITVAPSSAPAHSLLGDLHKDKGEWTEAISWYKLAVQINPLNYQDREKLAHAITKTYDHKTAAEQTKELLPPPEKFKITPTTILFGSVILALIAFFTVWLLWPQPESDTQKRDNTITSQYNENEGSGNERIVEFPDQNNKVQENTEEKNVPELGPGETLLPWGIIAKSGSAANEETEESAENGIKQNSANKNSVDSGISLNKSNDNSSLNLPPYMVNEDYFSIDEINKLQPEIRQALTQVSQNEKFAFTLNEAYIDPRDGTLLISYTIPDGLNSPTEKKQGLILAAYYLVWQADVTSGQKIKRYKLTGSATDSLGSRGTAFIADMAAEQVKTSRTNSSNFNSLLKYISSPWWRADLKDAPV